MRLSLLLVNRLGIDTMEGLGPVRLEDLGAGMLARQSPSQLEGILQAVYYPHSASKSCCLGEHV